MLKFGTPTIALPLAIKKCTVQTGCRMAGRSFTLPPLKLTRRPAYGTPKRENLHQGVRVVETPSNQRPRDRSDNPNALPSSAMASRRFQWT